MSQKKEFIRLLSRSILVINHVFIGLAISFIFFKFLTNSSKQKIISWWHGKFTKFLNIKISVNGKLPKLPSLIVSNHVSWLDIIVIGHLVPTVFLSKKEVKRWPILGLLTKLAGTIFINRGNGQSEKIKKSMIDKFSKNYSVTIFPEGTTSDGKNVKSFFPRLYAAAIEKNIPVVPVSIYYHVGGYIDEGLPFIGEQKFLENFFTIVKRPRSEVKINFFDGIKPDNIDRKSLAKKTHSIILNSIDELKRL